MVLFGPKRLYSIKSGCIQAKSIYLGKSGCIPAKWLYSSKSGCIRAKVDVFVQKLLYSGKMVVLVLK